MAKQLKDACRYCGVKLSNKNTCIRTSRHYSAKQGKWLEHKYYHWLCNDCQRDVALIRKLNKLPVDKLESKIENYKRQIDIIKKVIKLKQP
jgi:hypothetical protein